MLANGNILLEGRYNMRKLVLLILTICMVGVSAVAMAAKPYKHPDYKFNNVREIIVTEIDNQESRATKSFFCDEAADEKIMGAILEAAARQNLIIEDARNQMQPKGKGQPNHAPTKLEMRVVINNFGYYNATNPGYYETRYRNETRYYYDEDGNLRSRVENIPYQAWVKPQTYNVAVLNASYNFYDLETGTLVASMNATRSRSYENDASSMADRSVRDFFQRILKK